MTVAERADLLDACDRVDRETDTVTDAGTSLRPVLVALADLVSHAIRVWVVTTACQPRDPTDDPPC